MSKINRSSPRKPGAATEIGFVPKMVVADLVGLTSGEVFVEDIPIRPSLTAISVYLRRFFIMHDQDNDTYIN